MNRAHFFAVIGVLASFACAAKEKEPFHKEDTLEVSARVESVDAVTRTIVLQGPAGLSAIVAGPEVGGQVVAVLDGRHGVLFLVMARSSVRQPPCPPLLAAARDESRLS